MRRILGFISCGCLSLLLASGPGALAQCVETIDLYGTVVDSETGLPIPEVVVCLEDYCIPPCTIGPIQCGLCTKTNAAGDFEFKRDCEFNEDAPFSTWFFIHLSKPGYESKDLDHGQTNRYPRSCYSGVPFEVIVDFETIQLTKSPAGILETEDGQVPTHFLLHQNYPNPFNLNTTISFTLPEPAAVELVIYDILGRTVRTFDLAQCPSGTHTVCFDGLDDDMTPLPSGLYFYRLTAGDFTQTRQMVLLK